MVNMSTTTTMINSAISLPKYYNEFRGIHRILVKITLPYIFIIACLGVITNTSTVILLSKSFVTKNLKNKWTLIALALSDLVFNTALFIRVIHDIFYGKLAFLCLMISFLSNLAELLSACFTVLFTIQRFTAVRNPLQAVVDRRSSPIISLLIIVILSLIFCFALTHSNGYTDCHEELKLGWFIADALISFIIPFSLILIFNILIVNYIRKHSRSAISVQSTLIRHVKHDIYRKRNTNGRRDENFSMTCSDVIPLHSQHIESEVDIDTKLNSSTKKDENGILMKTKKKKKTKLLNNSSTETEFPATEPTHLTSLTEKTSSDLSSPKHSRSSSHQSTKSQNDNKNTTLSVLSNSNSLQKSTSRQSIDVDYISKQNTQTTQSIRVTRMLVLVSICFLILNAPAHICIIALKLYTNINFKVYHEHAELENFKQTKNLTSNQLKKFVFIEMHNQNITPNNHSSSHDIDVDDDQILIHLIYIAILLTQLIAYASYSINFFLYSFSGVSFRTSLKQFIDKLRRH